MAKKGKTSYLKELVDKTVKELVALRRKLRWELHALKMKHAMKGLKETHKIKEARRKLARIATILTLKIKQNYGNDRG